MDIDQHVCLDLPAQYIEPRDPCRPVALVPGTPSSRSLLGREADEVPLGGHAVAMRMMLVPEVHQRLALNGI